MCLVTTEFASLGLIVHGGELHEIINAPLLTVSALGGIISFRAADFSKVITNFPRKFSLILTLQVI